MMVRRYLDYMPIIKSIWLMKHELQIVEMLKDGDTLCLQDYWRILRLRNQHCHII